MKDEDSSDDSNEHANPEMAQIHVSNEVSISITLSLLEEDLEYKCELCNFSTIFRSSLKWHIMGDHQREDDFTCITLENIEQTLTGDKEEEKKTQEEPNFYDYNNFEFDVL